MIHSVRHIVVLSLLLVTAPALAQQPVPVPVPVPASATPVAKPAVSLPVTPTLSPADKKRALELKSEGSKLYAQGRYKEAIDKFSRAFAINLNIDLHYNIGVSYEQLEAWQECVSFLDRYIAKAPISPKKDRAANKRKSCEARLQTDQTIMIASTPKGATIYIDDKSTGVKGATPYTGTLPPGQHQVWIELDGHEPVSQTIDVQQGAPFSLNLQLRKFANQGWLFVDASIIDAQVYIDGKNVGLTPFEAPLPSEAGVHQVVVQRDGFTRFSTQVTVVKGRLSRVDAYVSQTETTNTWRTSLGWTLEVVGFLAVAGGVTAFFFAEEEFNDTDKFKDLALYEKIGYGAGGGLMVIGTALLIWDAARDVIAEKDRNKKYGEPVKIGTPTAFRFGAGPTGVGFGFSF
ncbi:MAG: hypothetical protein ACI9U2_002769 [Bradymonadia bacterium]|jgi:hypothetical protein